MAPELRDKESMYGGKSSYTIWLKNNGYKIPLSFFIGMNDLQDSSTLKRNITEFVKQLEILENGLYGVAIRSSAIGEDGLTESFAGHLLSFVGDYTIDEILEKVFKIVSNAESKGLNCGVLLQEKINAKFSGVIFSSHPITSIKQEIPILIGEGLGMDLVSGTSIGEDILVEMINNSFHIPKMKTIINSKRIIELCTITKKLENDLFIPVDVEWCLDNNGMIYILQCRPITSITSIKNGLIEVNKKNSSKIPSELIVNDKVKIRLIAEKYNVHISPAYIVASNGNYYITNKDLIDIPNKNDGSGYSVVLLYPSKIDGKILRQFACAEKDRQNMAYRKCQRYSLRSFQGKKTLCGAIQTIQLECLDITWKNYIIIQEIYNASYTGIIKKIENGIAIEIARGHFVPKGLVPTSNYLLDENTGNVIHKNEIHQKFKYEIDNGKVNRLEWDETICLNKPELNNIWQSLNSLVHSSTNAVEFGIRITEGKNQVYLIDLVEDKSEIPLSANDIANGVISPGSRIGKLEIIEKINNEESINLHYHDNQNDQSHSDNKIIYLADMPDISLLSLINKVGNENIGFIFKQGSSLSHLSIILRERKIPAIVLPKDQKLQSGITIEIDSNKKNKITIS